MNILRVPIIRNKRNGQISTYFKQEQLPKKVLESIRDQPKSLKKLLIKIRGVE